MAALSSKDLTPLVNSGLGTCKFKLNHFYANFF
ncbi:hypothetical protein COLO4_02829 [Corchorus olitorius]|uniref:Uncharacterized protein n=1 Tax=Corchorus olitorius TaxID=93759 RepID=A0A1R3L067_9ROSI|nr:hypothetical protein COLO4_02829 [Corchorus olitorius]